MSPQRQKRFPKSKKRANRNVRLKTEQDLESVAIFFELQRFSFAEVWQNSFFSVVRDKGIRDKNIRSKHRKRVPTSVFSPSRAAARRLKMACWEVSQTLGMERSESMDGRKRTVQIKFRVTEAERDLILEKMKLVPTRNMAAYLRKIAIDGYIIQVDHTDIKAMTAEIQKIGVNVNQIAKRVNSTGSVYQEDIEEIKGVLAEIWRLQRLSLLRER